LKVDPPAKITVKRGAQGEVRLQVKLQDGYHSNSHTPSEDYLIPLRLTWDPATFATAEVVYPKPHLEKYEFSPKPLSVFTGNFEIVTKYKVAMDAPTGPGMVTGKLRYQACSTDACLPPKTITVQLPVIIL
jgi:thiol:disulfide interchange protein DsbD